MPLTTTRIYLTAVALLAAAAAGGGWRPAALTVAPARAESRSPHAAKIGVELDGLGDGARARPFADVAKTLRPWTTLDGQKPAPVDERGWPASDAQSVMFDIRPFAAWLGPDHIDDPARFQPDWSGVYLMSFKGQARVRVTEDSRCTITNQRYD